MNSVKTFEEFKKFLKNHEIKTFSRFNVHSNPKGFLDEKREISTDMRLRWKDGLPYFHFGSRVYTCHHGKDKNLGKKRKYFKEKQEKAKTDHVTPKVYNLTRTTKKLDCPASITVTRVYALPQLKLENPTKCRKDVISAKIKSKLRNKEDIEGEEAFWFTLPSVDAHRNHEQEEISVIKEPVDPANSDEELIEDIEILPEENHEKNEGAVIYGELENKGSKKRKLINKCDSHMKNLGSVLWLQPESALLELEKDLVELSEKMQKRVIYDNPTGLSLEVNENKKNCNGMPMDKVKKFKTCKDAKMKQKGAKRSIEISL